MKYLIAGGIGLGVGLVIGFIFGFQMAFRGVWEYGVRKGKAVKIGKMFFWKDDMEPVQDDDDEMEGGDVRELKNWEPIKLKNSTEEKKENQND